MGIVLTTKYINSEMFANIMMNELLEFGLTQTEAKLYLALLELGPSLAGVLSRKAGVHRRSVYDALDRLMEKGLVGNIKENNRKYFEAANPERLREILKEREQMADKIVPELNLKYVMAKEKQETLFYRGLAGLKTAFEDQIAAGKTIHIFGASPLAYEILKYYFKWFDKRRAEKKIKVKIIFDAGTKKKQRRIPLAEVRYVPTKYASPAATNIYGDSVSIILWRKHNPFAIVIKDREIAEGYRKYFELVWNVAKK